MAQGVRVDGGMWDTQQGKGEGKVKTRVTAWNKGTHLRGCVDFLSGGLRSLITAESLPQQVVSSVLNAIPAGY